MAVCLLLEALAHMPWANIPRIAHPWEQQGRLVARCRFFSELKQRPPLRLLLDHQHRHRLQRLPLRRQQRQCPPLLLLLLLHQLPRL